MSHLFKSYLHNVTSIEIKALGDLHAFEVSFRTDDMEIFSVTAFPKEFDKPVILRADKSISIEKGPTFPRHPDLPLPDEDENAPPLPILPEEK